MPPLDPWLPQLSFLVTLRPSADGQTTFRGWKCTITSRALTQTYLHALHLKAPSRRRFEGRTFRTIWTVRMAQRPRKGQVQFGLLLKPIYFQTNRPKSYLHTSRPTSFLTLLLNPIRMLRL
ncbi:hypothetical protein EDC04DRAFT_2740819 [Pisolithus marmoratus]|nr:hypothetical protein EDC04DRAFT_2740819 [Pisolithus marmoratus]